MRDCPICGDPLIDEGVADREDHARRVELVQTWRCPVCREEFWERIAPEPDWRRFWRDRVAQVVAERRTS